MNDDRISIRGLAADCIIGVEPVERQECQRVLVDLDLFCDLSRAGQSDALTDTLDYKALRDRLIACMSESRDQLIERLAQRLAEVCLESEKVSRVTLRLAKPGALTGSKCVSVRITRTRGAGG